MGIDKQKYVAKISTASPLCLVIINFEIILDYLGESEKSIDNQKDFEFYILKARQFLLELRSSLDMQYEISSYLSTMYCYVDKQLAKFLFSKDLEQLNDAKSILKKIMEGFEGIKQEEKDKSSIMQNTDVIYAGLTYNKNGGLDEFVDIKQNKGFKA